ncbi:MAG: type IV pilus biogenesis/stability protein PilW [Pseudomonadota bacterium]|nr:type IV pilus biogenesis/stability protein PilW [Pseudomonadota bacterium]
MAVVLAMTVLGGCAGRPVQKNDVPEVAEINLKLGVGYMQSGHYAVALEKLQKALEYDEDMAIAHNAIAVLYEETGEDALAEQHFRRALELDSGLNVARMNFGRFLCARRRPAEGEALFRAVLDDQKAAETAYIGAGVCARQGGDPVQAETYLRQALEINPESPGALFELAGLSYDQDKALQARAFLQRYHAEAGYSPASLWMGIGIEEKLGDLEIRRHYATLLLSKFAGSREARRLLGSE